MDTWQTIQKLIRENQLKKSILARKMGISRNTLDSWLKEITAPDQKDIKKMSDILSEIQDTSAEEMNRSMNTNEMKDAALGMAFKTIMEGGTEYTLIPKTLLQDKHRITSLEQMESDKHFIGRLMDQNERLIARVLELEAKLPAVEQVK